jgi:allantoin racemase
MADRNAKDQSMMRRDVTGRPYRIALLNPNTSTGATATMMASARRVVPVGVHIEGRTVGEGPELIADPQALAQAACVVEAAAPALVAEGFDAIIVAGFGDPGVAALNGSLGVPVTGLGEAGIAEAAQGGLRYAIVTVTPGLHQSLVAAAHTHAAPSQLAAVRYTQGALHGLMAKPEDLAAALLKACQDAIALDGAQSIVIGGGPLASAAQGIARRLHVRVVDPVGAAVRLACARAGQALAVTG